MCICVNQVAVIIFSFLVIGYEKDNLKVQVTSKKKLRISGERRDRVNELYRFYQEFPIPADCDADQISANFRDGILDAILPKLNKSVVARQKGKPKLAPSKEAPKPDLKPTNWNANLAEQKQALQKVPSKKDTDKEATEQVEAQMPQKHKDVQQNQYKDQENVADKEVPPRTAVAKTSNDVSSKVAEKEKEMNDGNGKTNEKPKEKEQGGVTGMMEEKVKHQLGVTQQVLGVLVTEIRNPRKVTKLVLAVLLVLVLGLYAEDAFRFLLPGSDPELQQTI
ncbi:hypothetical protein SLEP1_g56651 [Rubroshorea leprosula]|uniref:SHSP domain-containing protein n=1 Tax=Rubroshorea leprosula TaxID=152421 RepID=A0AAV5MLN8_9ROSI|nr:hypothetical protein SLEP1_g56651 [Rubroshorea leprosula]